MLVFLWLKTIDGKPSSTCPTPSASGPRPPGGNPSVFPEDWQTCKWSSHERYHHLSKDKVEVCKCPTLLGSVLSP